jgi:hypothetical protein
MLEPFSADRIIEISRGPDVTAPYRLAADCSALTVAGVSATAMKHGLTFAENTVRSAVSALRAGKHLLLQGEPGTGKTAFANVLAEAAAAAGICRGALQTTASSDWSPAETVGTYRMGRDGELVFVRGLVLSSIDTDRWLIVDEFNRADIDRAIGPVFTVLSGQATELHFEEEVGDDLFAPVVITGDAGFISEIPSSVHLVPSAWRLIATMNTLDLDLLFEISQALLRRFAVITIHPPDAPAHRQLLERFMTGNDAIDTLIGRLADTSGTQLGPAITMDCARYALERYRLDLPVTAEELMNEVIDVIAAPQLVHLPDDLVRRFRRSILRADAETNAAIASAMVDSEPRTGDDEDRG